MTAAKAGKGLKLQRGDGGGSEVFTTIAEVLNVSSNPSRAMLEATSMDSASAEFVPGMPDAGQLTFTCRWVDSNAQQQGLYTDMGNGTLRNWKVIPNNHSVEASRSTRTFSGYVAEIGEEFEFNGVAARNVTIRVTGAITNTYAAAE